MTTSNISLGTSGWYYPEWEGIFYQKGEKRKLRAYSHVFSTVEINSTWYRYPSKGSVLGWLQYSPMNFIFTAKLPRIITHTKKLGLAGDVAEDLEVFLELMHPLQVGGKLACLLIQLPPSYDYNPENLEQFFQLLQTPFRFAIEFRNLTWIQQDTWKLLEKYQVAYVNVDEPLLPPEIHLTTDFTYFRWHGKGQKIWFDYLYSKEELDPWIPRIINTATKVKKVVGYFNNHFHGYAPENCLYVLERLGLLSQEQTEKIAQMKKKQPSISDFF